MLPAHLRLNRSTDIAKTMRFGKKYSSRLLVLHVAQDSSQANRCAFAVGKNVGNSVIRHRITRQLRHIMAAKLAQFPAGSQVVVRALPGTAMATSAELAENIDFALGKLLSE